MSQGKAPVRDFATRRPVLIKILLSGNAGRVLACFCRPPPLHLTAKAQAGLQTFQTGSILPPKHPFPLTSPQKRGKSLCATSRYGSCVAAVGPAAPLSPLAAARQPPGSGGRERPRQQQGSGSSQPQRGRAASRARRGHVKEPQQRGLCGGVRRGRAPVSPPPALGPYRLTCPRGSSERPGPAHGPPPQSGRPRTAPGPVQSSPPHFVGAVRAGRDWARPASPARRRPRKGA